MINAMFVQLHFGIENIHPFYYDLYWNTIQSHERKKG